MCAWLWAKPEEWHTGEDSSDSVRHPADPSYIYIKNFYLSGDTIWILDYKSQRSSGEIPKLKTGQLPQPIVKMILFAVHRDICFMALLCQWLTLLFRQRQMPWQATEKRSDLRKRALLKMDFFSLLSRGTIAISCYSKSPVANLRRLSNPWLSVWMMNPIVQAAKHPEPDPAKLLSMCFILGMQEKTVRSTYLGLAHV